MATVAEDTKENTSTLTIQSKNTGADEKNQFTIKDTYGDAIALAGTEASGTTAQDAIYRINNGEQMTSASNTIDLGDGIKATMLEASHTTIDITMKVDDDKAAAQVENLVKGYNELIAAAKSNDTEKSLQLNYQLAILTNTYSASLNRVGINMESSGKMVIDKDKLNEAAANGDLTRFFTQDKGASYGFANRLERLAGEIQTNPMKYTDVSQIGLTSFNQDPYGSFQTSRYQQAYNVGLFLNMFA